MKIFWLLIHSILARLATAGIERYLFFGSCSDEGWTCTVVDEEMDLDYTCSESVGWNVSFRKESFILPSSVHSLKITNCLQVTAVIDFSSTDEKYSLNALILTHISNLTFIENYQAASPPRSIILKDIGVIPYLPSYTFLLSSGLWDSILFQNVSIGKVAAEAFVNLTLSSIFVWDHVHVDFMNNSALNNITLPEGDIIIHECSFGNLEPYALQVHASNVIIKNSYIGEISVHGISVIADKFEFVNNSGLELVMFEAFDVHARETIIFGNNFQYLQVKALEAIAPFLWYDNVDFRQNVTYVFRENTIAVADPGALHVNLVAYIDIGGEVHVDNNMFNCSCEHLGWLGVLAAPGTHHPVLQDFHEMVLREESHNLCISNCSLPTSILEHLVADPDLCAANMTSEQLCALYFDLTQLNASASVITDHFCGHFMRLLVIVLIKEVFVLHMNV